MCFKIMLLVLVAVFIAKATADADHHLCGHRWADNGNFYSGASDVVQPINIRAPSSQSDLLVSDSTTKVLSSVITSLPTGLFKTELPKRISQGDFCSALTDTIHVADMDGDHYDDLLCRKADGSFTIRHYRRKGYSPEEPFAQDFQCGAVATITLLIGDFDGNHANDIICYDPAAANLDSAPVYFSQVSCYANHPHAPFLHRHHFHRGNGRSRRHSDCKKGLPMITALPSGVASACKPSDGPAKIFTLDANGDGKDDIACHQATTPTDSVVAYLSKGSTTDIFSGILTASTGITLCPFNDFVVIPADVDGDGDDDLVCASIEVDSVVTLKYSFFTAGSYQTSFTASTACSSVAFCSGTQATTAKLYVGDYNGDGKEDLMCRHIDTAGTNLMLTKIVFSEYKP